MGRNSIALHPLALRIVAPRIVALRNDSLRRSSLVKVRPGVQSLRGARILCRASYK